MPSNVFDTGTWKLSILHCAWEGHFHEGYFCNNLIGYGTKRHTSESWGKGRAIFACLSSFPGGASSNSVGAFAIFYEHWNPTTSAFYPGPKAQSSPGIFQAFINRSGLLGHPATWIELLLGSHLLQCAGSHRVGQPNPYWSRQLNKSLYYICILWVIFP